MEDFHVLQGKLDLPTIRQPQSYKFASRDLRQKEVVWQIPQSTGKFLQRNKIEADRILIVWSQPPLGCVLLLVRSPMLDSLIPLLRWANLNSVAMVTAKKTF